MISENNLSSNQKYLAWKDKTHPFANFPGLLAESLWIRDYMTSKNNSSQNEKYLAWKDKTSPFTNFLGLLAESLWI